jgi:hypothetical protein
MEQDLLRDSLISAPQDRPDRDLYRVSLHSDLQDRAEQGRLRAASRDRMVVPHPDRYRTAIQTLRLPSRYRMIRTNLSSASLTGKARIKNNPDLLYFSPLL